MGGHGDSDFMRRTGLAGASRILKDTSNPPPPERCMTTPADAARHAAALEEVAAANCAAAGSSKLHGDPIAEIEALRAVVAGNPFLAFADYDIYSPDLPRDR